MSKRGRKSKIVAELDRLTRTCGSSAAAKDAEPIQRDTGAIREEDISGLNPPCKRPRITTGRLHLPAENIIEDLAVDLGLRTFLLLYQACSFVPHSLLRHRAAMIGNIMAAADLKINEEELMSTIESVDTARSCSMDIQLPDVGPPPLEILWNATHATGLSHHFFLSPPTVKCLQCESELKTNNKPTQVVFYTYDGPFPATKIILRCSRCNLNYHPDIFGNSTEGYRYYEEQQRFVKCTQQAFMDRRLHSMVIAAGHHAWTSFEAWGEIYNEVFQESQNALKTQKFFSQNPIVAEPEESEVNGNHEACWGGYLSRKHVSEAFWNGEVEKEFRESTEIDFTFTSKSDREVFMNIVDCHRSINPYPHENCSETCKKRGCGTLWSIDGNWKLSYPICMYEEPKCVFTGTLKYVSSCPREPVHKLAFCVKHCDLAKKQNIPIDLRAYLKYRKEKTEVSLTKSTTAMVSKRATQDNDSVTAADCQGISSMIKNHPELPRTVDYTDEQESTKTSCNKDTGRRKQLQKWTRGHLFIVRGGGHIERWQPLYQSEGPAQVFLIVVTWLVAIFKDLPREEVKKKVISYDNMCHLNNLKVARSPLPLAANLQNVWLDVQKIIDSLHISNHKDARCKEQYSPDEFKTKYPDSNTMCCEQTFSWLSRYKRIVNSMPKTHHHFYLHRMVKYRNKYIELCYKQGRRPVLPSIKKTVNYHQ